MIEDDTLQVEIIAEHLRERGHRALLGRRLMPHGTVTYRCRLCNEELAVKVVHSWGDPSAYSSR